MKINYFLLVALLTISAFSQNNKAFEKFDTKGMETSILVPQSPIVNITDYNNKTINTYSFYQAYKTIAQNDFQDRFKPLSSLKEDSKQSHFTNYIPLAILLSDFESITEQAFRNQVVTRDAQGFIIRRNTSEAIFEKRNLSIAAPLRAKHKGLETTFSIASKHIFNATENAIEAIAINFDDGQDFRPIPTNQNIQVSYLEAGDKTLTFQITLANGSVIYRQATIEIAYSNADLERNFNRVISTFNSTITPDLSPYGETTSYPGTGEYELFLSADNILDKPIILVDGFDPADGRDIAGIYELLDFEENGTTSNLGDLVRDEGFDVVILNFPVYTRAADNKIIDGGVDFIERNAMLLVELINSINAQKIGVEDNVIIGPSMGGLISRYAINYMENNNLDHETRLWISFDSPHHGANVPIGFQHQFNFLAFGLDDFTVLGDQNVEELQPIIDGMLRSSAARQMLVDQFEPHITNSDGVTFNSALNLPQQHPYKAILDTRMNSLTASGFPELTRNISIINGSGINSRYQDNTAAANNLNPGSRILNANIDVISGAELKAETRFTPNAGSQVYSSKVHLDFAWWFPLANDRINNATSRAPSFSNGVDAASGGLFDILSLTEDLSTDGLVGDFLNALSTDYFNFIPSVSSMAFEITNNEIDWFHTPSNVTTARATTSTTPFDAWYMPNENEPHVTLTPQNVDFAINEIILETLHTDSFSENFMKLEQNPVSQSFTILSSQTYNNANISIVDITGKTVLQLTLNVTQRTTVPFQMASGLYILNVESDGNQILKTKLLVK
ncbi:T9SS type A sorting domain-containing protein [Bizionia hallyeonensis]|uniref:T9SS type A sorting domain-containing protein n=2 Tax=Bizionia hallyeonensis TaxID=1123757 RepID=A0ABW0C8A9_9FLAO